MSRTIHCQLHITSVFVQYEQGMKVDLANSTISGSFWIIARRYEYIGEPYHHYNDHHRVGNGSFKY